MCDMTVTSRCLSCGKLISECGCEVDQITPADGRGDYTKPFTVVIDDTVERPDVDWRYIGSLYVIATTHEVLLEFLAGQQPTVTLTREQAIELRDFLCQQYPAEPQMAQLEARLEQAERNARLFGVRWAIDQGYIDRDYADDALQAAGSDKC